MTVCAPGWKIMFSPALACCAISLPTNGSAMAIEKIVNIMPGNGNAAEVEDGDIIWTKKSVDTDEMLETLSVSNKNVALISENLKLTVEERLRKHQSAQAFFDELRRAGQQARSSTSDRSEP